MWPRVDVLSSNPTERSIIPLVKAGFCNATVANKPGNCVAGNHGSWNTTSYGLHTLGACALKCLSCSRCRFVSFSVVHEDCSWYHHCSMGHLRRFGGRVPQEPFVSAAIAQTRRQASWWQRKAISGGRFEARKWPPPALSLGEYRGVSCGVRA